MGTLQAKIAAAYLFYWIRGWFRAADDRQKLLAEADWKTAVRLLDSMGRLRKSCRMVRPILRGSSRRWNGATRAGRRGIAWCRMMKRMRG